MAIVDRDRRYGVRVWRDGRHCWVGTFSTLAHALEAEALAARGLKIPPDDPLEGFRFGNQPLVYFIQAPALGLVKIGFTTDLARRYSDLSIGSPVDLKVLHVVTGASIELEAELHARFAVHRVRGEWFRIGGQLEEFLHGAINERVMRLVAVEEGAA